MICAWIDTSSEATGSSQTMHVGLHRERARDGDALALPARELVRIALGEIGIEPDPREPVGDIRRARGRG